MKKGRYEKSIPAPSKSKLITVLLLVAILLLLIMYACGSIILDDEPQTTEPSVEQNPSSIAIPGYEILELKANTKKQAIRFSNPPQNVCYFQISLYLEDGTLLWQSELIEPGKTSKAIVLTQKLEKGTYANAVLKYACFRMDEELSPLNGAETRLTLWVK